MILFIHLLTYPAKSQTPQIMLWEFYACHVKINVLLYYFILLFIYFMIFFNHLLTFPPKSQTPQITLWEFNACHVKYIIPITICMFYYCYYF